LYLIEDIYIYNLKKKIIIIIIIKIFSYILFKSKKIIILIYKSIIVYSKKIINLLSLLGI